MMKNKILEAFIEEVWHDHFEKYMKEPDHMVFNNQEEPEIEDNPLNPYQSANNSLSKVKANMHPKTQKAGVGRGSGTAGGARTPGGNRQSTSSR